VHIRFFVLEHSFVTLMSAHPSFCPRAFLCNTDECTSVLLSKSIPLQHWWVHICLFVQEHSLATLMSAHPSFCPRAFLCNTDECIVVSGIVISCHFLMGVVARLFLGRTLASNFSLILYMIIWKLWKCFVRFRNTNTKPHAPKAYTLPNCATSRVILLHMASRSPLCSLAML